MFVRQFSAVLAVAAGAALLAGCDGVPSTPLIGNPNLGPGPTISGTVKNVTGSNLRVGLLGTKTTGQQKLELTSSAVAGSAFTLQLPSEPGLNLMVNDTESITFTLQAYEDKNSNGRFDAGDVETDAGVAGGTFRFFAEDAPGRQAGWNQYKNGQYTKSIDVAFALDGNVGGS